MSPTHNQKNQSEHSLPKRSSSNKTQNLLDDDIKSIEQRLLAFQEQKTNTTQNNQQTSTLSAGLGFAMRLGVEMAATLLVGASIGYALDTFFDTSPIALLCGVFLGIISGITSVWRTAQRFEQTHDKLNTPTSKTNEG